MNISLRVGRHLTSHEVTPSYYRDGGFSPGQLSQSLKVRGRGPNYRTPLCAYHTGRGTESRRLSALASRSWKEAWGLSAPSPAFQPWESTPSWLDGHLLDSLVSRDHSATGRSTAIYYSVHSSISQTGNGAT